MTLPSQTHAAQDEAWGRRPYISTWERAALAARLIETIDDVIAKPDWYFAGRRGATLERLAAERAAHVETLEIFEKRMHA